ncbi:histidine phosphatase family protein [Patescibacteria group bacterium]
MTMPIDLVWVRHGQSDLNVANKLSRRGDDSMFTEEFVKKHSSLAPLTDPLGRSQAVAASEWLKADEWLRRGGTNVLFDRCYASEYVRAMQTAALLDLPGAQWYLEYHLRERDWGELDIMTDAERRKRFGEKLDEQKRHPLLWTPPGGTSMADTSLRIDRMFNTLGRECGDKRVIIVSHGEVMWLARIRIERLTERRFRELKTSGNPHDKIHNCQILHYTRRDPETGKLLPHLRWMRSICPTDLTRSSNEWQRIMRPSFSNEELLAEADLMQAEAEKLLEQEE